MVTRRLIITCIAGLLSVLLTPGSNAHAGSPRLQSDGPTLDVRVGFDGYVQSGAWAPIYVIASNNGDDIQGELRVNVQDLSAGGATYTRDIDLPRGSRKLVTLYVADLSSFTGNIDVELASGNRIVTRARAGGIRRAHDLADWHLERFAAAPSRSG